MADERNLELKSIIAKFNQSSSALDSLTEKLSAISSASTEITRAEAGITESHLQARRMVDEVKSISVELRRATVSVESALESVATFLNGTELNAMRMGIEKVSNALDNQISDLNKKLEDKSIIEKNLIEQVSTLQGKITAVPEKFKKKLGWI